MNVKFCIFKNNANDTKIIMKFYNSDFELQEYII